MNLTPSLQAAGSVARRRRVTAAALATALLTSVGAVAGALPAQAGLSTPDLADYVDWSAPDGEWGAVEGFRLTIAAGDTTSSVANLPTDTVTTDATGHADFRGRELETGHEDRLQPGTYTLRIDPPVGSTGLTGGYWDGARGISPTPVPFEWQGHFTHVVLNVAVFRDYPDVPQAHPFATDIRWLVGQGIAGGYDDGTFRPGAAVSRQAMAAFLYRAAGEPDAEVPATATFSDVPVGSTFFPEVEWLADSGIAGGFTDGTFRPTAPVSRQAMAAFLHRFAGEPAAEGTAPTFPDVGTGNQFRSQIAWLASTGITGGYSDGTYRPTAPVSRQAMAAFLHRYHDLQD